MTVSNASTTTPSSVSVTPSLTAARPGRLLSLDVLRGLTIAFMILVNNNGNEAQAYWPLKHAAWNGFTPTDLFLHVLRRSIILYLLGLVVNSFPYFHLHTMRFYGVLPRIAICYLIVASLYLISPAWRSKATLAIAALAGYWILMRFVPVPGYGVPTHAIPLLDRDANLTAWLDRQIFSASHLYERTRDPEGLLSTIPALATALLGLLTGIWLRTQRTLRAKATGIATAGFSGVLLGGLWNLSFPINKKLWTSSYVLFAGGLSLLLLALCLLIVDLRQKSPGRLRTSYQTRLLLLCSIRSHLSPSAGSPSRCSTAAVSSSRSNPLPGGSPRKPGIANGSSHSIDLPNECLSSRKSHNPVKADD